MNDSSRFTERQVKFLELTMTMYLTAYFFMISVNTGQGAAANLFMALISLAFSLTSATIIFRCLRNDNTKLGFKRAIAWLIGPE